VDRHQDVPVFDLPHSASSYSEMPLMSAPLGPPAAAPPAAPANVHWPAAMKGPRPWIVRCDTDHPVQCAGQDRSAGCASRVPSGARCAARERSRWSLEEHSVFAYWRKPGESEQ
jgi:hypothetical protein